MRVSRTWRDLSNRKRAGFGHDAQNDPGKGELAIFCPACPQPDINLPKDWVLRYNGLVHFYAHLYCLQVANYNSDTVSSHYVVDGNFTAQHMKMHRPKDDIPLSDGLAYMVANEPYQKHIAQAANNEEVHIIGFEGYDLHIYASFASSRGQHARTIGLLMMSIPIKLTCMPLVWVLLPVLVMVALFPIL